MTRPTAVAQFPDVDAALAHDVAFHVNLWFVRKQQQALRRIHAAGGDDVTSDDLDLVAELLNSAVQR